MRRCAGIADDISLVEEVVQYFPEVGAVFWPAKRFMLLCLGTVGTFLSVSLRDAVRVHSFADRYVFCTR